jgi:hypothetical protein
MKTAKLLFTILTLITTLSISGRSQSVAPVSFNLFSTLPVGNSPSWVTAADINGDGKIDLISMPGIGNNNSIIIFTNDGLGDFLFASSPGVGSAPASVAAADVNGDGKLDLISANYGDATLSVLTNDGQGEFVISGTYAVGNHVYCVIAADVNGDGKLDLITANTADNTLSVLTNDGLGGFVTSGTYTVGNHPFSVIAIDINGDAKPDLVCVNALDNTITALTNNGSGSFVASGTYSVGQNPNQVTAADINGDGKPDLITANYSDGTLTILTNDGNGGFGFSSTVQDVFGVRSVVAADVNGDGSMDLICVPGLNNSVTVFTNNGTGGFFQLTNFPGPGSYPFSVVTADVNGDGRPDVICANVFGDSLTVLTNATQFPLPLLPHTASGIAAVTNDFVVGVDITDGGYGYTNTPQVRFIGGGGSGVEAYAVVSNGVVTSIIITNAGYGYTTAPIVIIDPPFIPNPILRIAPMSFLSFSNLTVGGNYQLQQFLDYYWANLPISFTATNAIYTNMVAGIGGTYRLAINPVPTQAFATPEVINGFVVGATVTFGGSGYVTTPNVNVVDDFGSNAVAAAGISGGVVTNINILEAGYGYSTNISIQIDPPLAAAVSPLVQPVMQLDLSSLVPYDNYQIQFTPSLDAAWGNWNGGLFSPTSVTNSQYLFITNGSDFFRVQYVP